MQRIGNDSFRELLARATRPPTPEEAAAIEARRVARKTRNAELMEATLRSHLRAAGVTSARGTLLADVLERLTPSADDSAAMRAARGFMAGSSRHLVLTGFVGSGKTVAAAWCLTQVTRVVDVSEGLLEWDSERAMFLSLREYLRTESDFRHGEAVRTRAQAARVLVLDEVGMRVGQALTEREEAQLVELATARDSPHRKTIWTSNLSALKRQGQDVSDFGAFVGERVRSRIGRAVHIADSGQRDYRRSAL